MEELVLFQEEENKRRGIVFSVVIHVALLLICLLPWMQHQDPPPEQQGVIVAFGFVEEPSVKSESQTKVVDTPTKSSPTKATKAKTVTKAKTSSKTTTLEQDEPIIISKAKKVNDEKIIEDTQEEKIDPEVLEAERRAEEERLERERQEALNKKKKKFGSLFNNSSEGTNENPAGNPNGKKNSDAWKGTIDSKGKIGGGLGNRGLVFEPTLRDKSQKEGIVVVRICVDTEGKVIEARFQQKGSKTTDQYLVDLAVKHAKKYKFTPGELDKQCGTLTLDFKLK